MPGTRGDPQVGAGDLLAPAPDHAVKAHVVLQLVRSRHVVVVRVDQAHCDTAGLVDLAVDGLEPDAGLNIPGGHWLIDREGEAVVGRVGRALFECPPTCRFRVGDHTPE